MHSRSIPSRFRGLKGRLMRFKGESGVFQGCQEHSREFHGASGTFYVASKVTMRFEGFSRKFQRWFRGFKSF